MGRSKKQQTPAVSPEVVSEQVEKPILQPVVVEQISDPIDEIILKPHHVLMIGVNPSGDEVPGTEFQIHKRGLLKKPYNNTEKFKLKKSEQ